MVRQKKKYSVNSTDEVSRFHSEKISKDMEDLKKTINKTM